MGSRDRAQDTHKIPDTSAHRAAPDTRPLDTHHRLPDPEQPDSREPVVLRPVTAKGSLRIQVDLLPTLMRGQGLEQGIAVSLPMYSQANILGTPGLKIRHLPRDSLTLPLINPDPAVYKHRGTMMSQQETGLNIHQMSMEKP